MLHDSLRGLDLAALLVPGTFPMDLPPGTQTRTWQKALLPWHEELCSRLEPLRSTPWPSRSATGFLAFVRTGSRQADETPYFARRRRLILSVLAVCEGDASLLDDVVDGLWCICEETSWVISAHNVNPVPGAPPPERFPLPREKDAYIDLFSAQTGMILCLACHLLGEALDAVTPILRERVRSEIRERLIVPFETRNDFWWMGVLRSDLCNWTPWILSNLLLCAGAELSSAHRLADFIIRSAEIMDRWLEVIPEDGGLDEGTGYWNMAGGALADYLEMLERITAGSVSLWHLPKIRNLLRFPLRTHLGDGWFVNFADCDARVSLSGERLELCAKKLHDPDLAVLGRAHRASPLRQIDDVPHFTRLLSSLFSPSVPCPPPVPRNSDYIESLQLRILSQGGWTLAAKGGHNGENHNHNDVGSLILMLDRKPVVVDAGNMTYTALTFSSRRYTLWNTRSGWHNVPLIGGTEQAAGRQYAARNVRCTPEGMVLDLTCAYPPECGLTSLERSLFLTPEGLTLRDRFRLMRPAGVTEVFLLRERPVLQDGVLTFGSACLRFSPSLSLRVEERPVTDARMQQSFPGSLWRVCLTAPEAASLDLIFEFRRNCP